MGTELSVISMIGLLMLLVATGTPLPFCIGIVGIISGYFVWGPHAFSMVALQAVGAVGYVFLAIPFFVLMGSIIEKTNIGDDAFKTIYNFLGPLRGGLAAGTVILSAAFAAMVGVSSAATVTMGVTALPPMFKLKYDKEITLGAIQAGGALGVLIPPSITFVVIGVVGEISIGRLFAGGVLPGLLLASLFIVYTLTRCYFQPHLGPEIPKEDRISLSEKIISLKGFAPPLILSGIVLAPIFLGITTITEASALGAIGSIIIALLLKRLSLDIIKKSVEQTFVLSCMIMWIIIGSAVFSGIFSGSGIHSVIGEFIEGSNIAPWAVILSINITLIVLGCFIDVIAIIMITIPLFLPIITDLGFNPVWFGVMFLVNMEIGFLTPPFGYNLFYIKGVVDSLGKHNPQIKEVSMSDIYKSVFPFVILQMIGLIIIIIFPQIVLWLPNLLF